MTPRTSVRAAAREIYGQLAAETADASASTAATPTPDPSPQGGREQEERGKTPAAPAVPTDLTAHVRALYEDSAVPVREIAALAGVSERTIYKYVAKGGWKRRYQDNPRGTAAARANRGRSFRPAPGFAPGRGSGARFIRRDDIGRPIARGLKATDPRGETLAAAACRHADRLARQAQAEAEAVEQSDARLRALQHINRTLEQLNAYREEHFKDQRKREREHHRQQERHRPHGQPFRPYRERAAPALPADDSVEWASRIALQQGVDWLTALQAEDEAERGQ